MKRRRMITTARGWQIEHNRRRAERDAAINTLGREIDRYRETLEHLMGCAHRYREQDTEWSRIEGVIRRCLAARGEG